MSMLCFTASNKSCDYTVMEPSGVITSPDWDQDGYYEFNVNCFWTVKVGVYNVIRCLNMYVAIQFFSVCYAADFVEVIN